MTSDLTERRCPHCEAPLPADAPAVACPSCGAPHHAACWEARGGCAAADCPGCAKAPAAVAPTPPRPPDPALERLLSEIYIRLRQGRHVEAAQRLAQAKILAPTHPAVVEIEGDIAMAQGRFHTAKDLYRKALDADPANGKLEEKFATALVQTMTPQLNLQRLPDDSLWSNRVPRHPLSSTLLSAVFPGIGQIYNGDWLKGLLVLFTALAGGIAETNILWKVFSDYRHASPETVSAPALVLFTESLFRGPQAILTLLLLAVWIYGMADAWLVAKHSR